LAEGIIAQGVFILPHEAKYILLE